MMDALAQLPPMHPAPAIGRPFTARLLPDARRLHLQDGPIDLVIEAFGPTATIHRAYRAACTRFGGLLDELCTELPELRVAAGSGTRVFQGPVSRRMERAVLPFAAEAFITPMAAVAGSVADEILAAMLAASGEELTRAYVNNGGDIALHLAHDAAFTVGLVDRPDQPRIIATANIGAADPIRGLATSGAPGRSFSLGIADAVTVLAATASQADAAATIIANAVDLPHDPRIERRPAAQLQPDSDLGERLVTVAVARLDAAAIADALAGGEAVAARLLDQGLIAGASLHLQGETWTVGLSGRTTRLPASPSGSTYPRII